jgi:16S rRNA processing protein RimM
MPPPPAPTARSSSRSSKRNDAPAPGGGRSAPPRTGSPSDDALIAIGRIVGAHALRGILRLRPYQPPTPSLAPDRTVYLEDREGRRPFRVVSAAPHGRGLVLLELDGVTDRNAAEALVRTTLLVPREALPPADDDEFYWHEIVGFRAETTDGTPLGEIVDVFHTGTNDVWTVHGGGREYLIPVIQDVVREIDRAGRRVVIHPMPGLLD